MSGGTKALAAQRPPLLAFPHHEIIGSDDGQQEQNSLWDAMADE